MGFFSEDMLPMLGVYEAETSELMAGIDAIVARVEREKAFTHEDIAELFRCAHTVKGSSAMMGLDSLAELTHKVEDLFDHLRGDPSLAEGHVADILDRLYSFSDYVKDEISRMGEDDYAPADADGLIRDVASYAATLAGGEGTAGDSDGGSGGGDEAAVGEASAPQPDVEEGSPDAGDAPLEEEGAALGGTTLKVSFKPDVPMVNARALVIMRQLGGQVNVLSQVPDDLSAADAARVIAEDGLLIALDASDVDKARQLLAKNSFINRITVLDEAEAAPSAPNAGQDGRGDGAASPAADKFIKLRWSAVRDLQDMVGEFLLHAARLKALCGDMAEANELRGEVSHTARLVEDLAYRVDKMAMVSMSAMVPQLSRMVRDMCRNSGKQVSFEVHGGDIEIDRNLYNSISDPLLHIIRNAVDHGIESPEERLAAGKSARGKVTLSVENLGARVAFRIADDGKGIDTDKVLAKAEASGKLERPAESYTRAEILYMVMMAGLSTSHEVTQYSGRGVGMDVVSTVVRDFNGRVEIKSEPGEGTSMTMFMPVSVTTVECLCFRIGPSVYNMPLHNLNKIFTADEVAGSLSRFEGSVLFDYEKRQLPVLDMHDLLGCPGKDAFYIVCHSLDDEFVIGVDGVLGDFSCANKPLPSCLGAEWQAACPIRNVAVMDDGTVGYVLNAALLASRAQGRGNVSEAGNDKDDRGDEDDEDIALLPVELASVPSQVFAFTLGDGRYALPIEQVERLDPMLECSVTPRGLPYLIGLASYRNKAIAVFDLAASADAQGDCPYVLIVSDGAGERIGLAVTSAIGVLDLDGAVMAEEQPEPRAFAAGLRSAVSLVVEPKEPPVTLLVRS